MRALLLAAVLLLSVPLLAQHAGHDAHGESPAMQADVGEIAFANSGSAAAQQAFTRGLALLHNFEYAQAAEEFRSAQTTDPGFAMAYWGEAMTHTHPVWFRQDLPAARAILERLAPTAAERRARTMTERERAYLDAVEILYGAGTKQERDFLYSAAMERLYARFRGDVDAAAFYALSLLGTAHQGRDFAIYMRAAAVLEEKFSAHQRHPGVLHYLIHSYDDPIHAPLGMRAATRYGAVAPNAGHALHMTSHIFVALGLWDDVLSANRRAVEVVDRFRASRNKPQVHCGHYSTWLHYALLQKGDLGAARNALDACRAAAFEVPFVSGGAMDSQSMRLSEYVTMRAHQLTSGGTLTDADQVVFADGTSAAIRFTAAYADALAAARTADAKALAAVLERFRGAHQEAVRELASDAQPAERMRLDIALQQVEALQLLAAGRRGEAIATLRRAAAAEEAMPFDFGPPAVEQPTLELLAQTLLAAGQTTEAHELYRKALARTPGRTVTAEGVRRAASATR